LEGAPSGALEASVAFVSGASGVGLSALSVAVFSALASSLLPSFFSLELLF
jgi:hypothetical protein